MNQRIIYMLRGATSELLRESVDPEVLWRALWPGTTPIRCLTCDAIPTPPRRYCDEHYGAEPWRHWLETPSVNDGPSMRLAKCLDRAGIVSVQELLNWTPYDVTGIRGLGPIAWRELGRLLRDMEGVDASWWIEWDDAAQ